MPIHSDSAYAQAVAPTYGEFLGVFESEHRQVDARLFKKHGFLEAYLSYEKGLEPSHVTDSYLGELEQFAKKHGLQLRIKHVVS